MNDLGYIEVFKLILKHKADITFYKQYILSTMQSLPHNVWQLVKNVDYYPYLYSTMIVQFPGAMFMMFNFVSIFTMYPTTLGQVASRILYHNTAKKLYFDEINYHYILPEDSKSNMRLVETEELKSLTINSTFSL